MGISNAVSSGGRVFCPSTGYIHRRLWWQYRHFGWIKRGRWFKWRIRRWEGERQSGKIFSPTYTYRKGSLRFVWRSLGRFSSPPQMLDLWALLTSRQIGFLRIVYVRAINHNRYVTSTFSRSIFKTLARFLHTVQKRWMTHNQAADMFSLARLNIQ